MWYASTFLVGVVAVVGLANASITNSSRLSTPPMGFNNWARFQCNLNETLFVETAESMVRLGFLKAGYTRLNLDDCWMQHARSPEGKLLWNTTLFPHGIPWLRNHVHEKGFSLGIYADSGNETCGEYPGSLDHEEMDVKTFREWGIDYLKLDGCKMFPKPGQSLEEMFKEVYGRWTKIFQEPGNAMIYSESAPAYFCGSPDFPKVQNKSSWYRVMEWAPQYGELARHSDDINVYDDSVPNQNYWASIMKNYGFNVQLARYQQPGFYNDPDFLIADANLTIHEKMSQFALWASFSAPLIISAYIPALPKEVIKYLTNEDIIKVDQDPLGLQATLVSQDGTWDVLTKSLVNGDRLVTVLNRGNITANTSVDVKRMGLLSGEGYYARNLWKNESSPITSGKLSIINLSSHATAIYRISNITNVVPTGMIFNTASKGCMTASSTKQVSFEDCAGLDSQVWHLSQMGSISPVSSPSECLTSTASSATLERCNSPNRDQRWNYHISGSVSNEGTGLCLAGERGKAAVEKCEYVFEKQVFGLPSGVKILH